MDPEIHQRTPVTAPVTGCIPRLALNQQQDIDTVTKAVADIAFTTTGGLTS
jgi:hypothetical protein